MPRMRVSLRMLSVVMLVAVVAGWCSSASGQPVPEAATLDRTVSEAIGAMAGVRHIEPARVVDGRTRLVITTDGSKDIRPDIFDHVKAKGWVLYELHQETRSLEELFRQLTSTSEGA